MRMIRRLVLYRRKIHPWEAARGRVEHYSFLFSLLGCPVNQKKKKNDDDDDDDDDDGDDDDFKNEKDDDHEGTKRK